MKNKKLYIILGILSIIFLSIGGTFAYYTASATATNITQIKSGNLTMTVDGGGSTNVSFMPAKCTSSYAIKKKIVASATNTSGGKVSFSIGMNIATLGEDFKRNTMRYVLTTNASSCTQDIVASGSFKNKTVGEDVWLIKNDYDNITQLSSSYTKTYYLYIWLDETETQNLSGSISVSMKGTSSNNPDLKTKMSFGLYDKIKNNVDTTTIDFSQTSEASSTNGIYMSADTDSGNPVYYYRGNVDNHLIFANFCWRIVRTTETGGVKLIYDGVPFNGQCNNTNSATTIGDSKFNESSSDAKYVGYMYGSSIDDTANTTDSTIKTVVDTWYEDNMTSYTSQLEDTVFCNDRSYIVNSDSSLYFKSRERLMTDKLPTLKCQNDKDKFTVETSNGNGALTYPVGLITADEVVYAGGESGATNKLFYLFNSTYTWTLSPTGYVSLSDRGFYLGAAGYLNDYTIVEPNGVRPVISLKPGIILSSGNGTSTSPYVVE